MIITIHQPEHLPWLGFFNKLSKSELFVFLDNVQFEKNYFQNRNKIVGTNGVQWIGIPVSGKGHMNRTIADMTIAEGSNRRWKDKYLQTVYQSYSKYPYFSEVFPVLEEVFSRNSCLLCDYNIEIIKAFSAKLGFFPSYVRASELEVCGAKSGLILDICKKLHADTYISGPSGRDYLEPDSFYECGINVIYNDFRHPIYHQCRTEEFIPFLSSVDLFMNEGFTESKRIITSEEV